MSIITPNTTTEPVEYTLTIRPQRDATDPAGVRRLRRLLKFALRTCHLRCTAVVQTDGEEPREVAP